MTAHYARLHDSTVRRHWEAARKVDITGETVTVDPDGPLAEAAWAKQRLGRATQALPNGFCGLPVQQSCPHANACLTCPMFLTTDEHSEGPPGLSTVHRSTGVGPFGAAGDEYTRVGDGERHQVGDGCLDPHDGGGVAAHDHVELVDAEQDGAHDKGDGRGLPQMRSIADDGDGFPPRRPTHWRGSR